MNSSVLYALGAAALFGASTPFAKLLLGEVSPWVLAAVLYLGSGIGLAAWIALRAQRPARVRAARASAPARKDGALAPAPALPQPASPAFAQMDFRASLLFIGALCAPAWGADSIAVLERRALAIERTAGASHHLDLTVAYFDDSWTPEAIQAALREGARILAQCRIGIKHVALVRIGAPARYRDFYTPISRELAGALALPKPTIYFVARTRQQPAFEAEAIGRGNSGSRPELRDTVWVTRGARDPGIVLAHELAHVLMDSGEHSDEPRNLMRADTAPGSARLDEAQCARLRGAASANGLLSPAAPGSR